MEITGVRASLLEVNCYALAAGAGEPGAECVLVDAGWDCGADMAALLAERGWRPVAVVLTHGHADHVLGLPNLLRACGEDLPVHLGRADVHRLADPAAGVSAQFARALEPLTQDWAAPAVRPVDDGDVLECAGLTLTARAAPGHTEGSTLFTVEDPRAGEGESAVLVSGDVLFAGSVGRTDLPGGDPAAMARTLAALRTLPDTPVLPGHGPATRLSHELAANPFL
ncbi:MBL fold metallo-hydrolase [Brevibacterium album]|uniref:MBL fold metallo-hydrolase n=1 Tax=Brevibacterium album TaxID=417948 RepID=UPI000490568D|nr:MBL fold metallo-hydrolase [Brevibacterium album]